MLPARIAHDARPVHSQLRRRSAAARHRARRARRARQRLPGAGDRALRCARYLMWPGPNSNTYVDAMLRSCHLHVDLPATAVGKDHRRRRRGVVDVGRHGRAARVAARRAASGAQGRHRGARPRPGPRRGSVAAGDHPPGGGRALRLRRSVAPLPPRPNHPLRSGSSPSPSPRPKPAGVCPRRDLGIMRRVPRPGGQDRRPPKGRPCPLSVANPDKPGPEGEVSSLRLVAMLTAMVLGLREPGSGSGSGSGSRRRCHRVELTELLLAPRSFLTCSDGQAGRQSERRGKNRASSPGERVHDRPDHRAGRCAGRGTGRCGRDRGRGRGRVTPGVRAAPRRRSGDRGRCRPRRCGAWRRCERSSRGRTIPWRSSGATRGRAPKR